MTDAAQRRPRPLVLCILDGFGERRSERGNAIKLAKTPVLDALADDHPRTLIGTSGPDVGLPEGQMGNSEVGHLNFGAGRIAQMDITRIDAEIEADTLRARPMLDQTLRIAKHHFKEGRLHLLGLLSDGGVHSSMKHLFALIDMAAFEDIPVVVHAFLDGRDTPPRSAGGYLQDLDAFLEGGKKGVIGTISGRYYAMDRDKRWDRVDAAYRAIVRGEAPRSESAFEAVRLSYLQDIGDEFVVPTRIGDYEGIRGSFMADYNADELVWGWYGEETGLSFNFRPDRMRELSALFTRQNLPPEALRFVTERNRPILAFQEHCYATMTDYDAALKVPVIYPRDPVVDSFGEVIAKAGLKQLRCAETEKYAHVTYFFNGGREEPFEGEDRKLIPSPRNVATYDLKPEMSAAGVSSAVVDSIEGGEHDFILVNFANPDMVGHTGKLDAAIKAIEAVDEALGAIVEALKKAGGAIVVTSDHGNCEQMLDSSGKPHTAHTTNPVPLYLADFAPDGDKAMTLRDGGRICDVAPTLLELLGLPKPAAMTGLSLLEGPAAKAG